MPGFDGTVPPEIGSSAAQAAAGPSRAEPMITVVRPVGLSGRASAKIGKMMQAQANGDFAQVLSAGGEESAEQAAFAEFLDAGSPALGAAAQSFEDAS